MPVLPPAQSLHGPQYLVPPGAQTLVVFIHGFMGSPRQFDCLAKTIHSHGNAVLSLLLPGHGGKTRGFAQATSAAWQAYVRKAIGLHRRNYRRVYLVGHSMGGLLALSYATEHAVQGIFLIACPLRLRRFGLQQLKIRLAQLILPSSHPMKKAYLNASSVPLTPALLWSSAKPTVQLRRLMSQTESALPAVCAPVTAVFSSADELVALSSRDILKSGLPSGAESVTLSESSHAYYTNTDKRRIADSLLEMLTKT